MIFKFSQSMENYVKKNAKTGGGGPRGKSTFVLSSGQWGLTLSGAKIVKNQSGTKWSTTKNQKQRMLRIGIRMGPGWELIGFQRHLQKKTLLDSPNSTES